MMQTSQIHRILLFSCVCFLASCASSVGIEYFTLRDESQIHADSKDLKALDTPIPIDIAVENFRSNTILRRNEILLREKNSAKVFPLAQHVWLAMPEEMVTSFFINYLKQKKVFRHIVNYPSNRPVSYVVEGILHEFEFRRYAQDRYQAHVGLQVFLIDRDNIDIVWDSGILHENIDFPVSMPFKEVVGDSVVKIEECLCKVFCGMIAQMQEKVREHRPKHRRERQPEAEH